MAVAERRADTTWEGNVARGGGKVKLASSGACGELPISLPTRAGETNGNTSPEELIAAAHSGCYAMALSNVLSQQDSPPEKLEVSANVVLDKAGEGFKVSRSDLTVSGTVPGIDADAFEQAAKQAEQACPISNVLRGNAEIGLEVSLAA